MSLINWRSIRYQLLKGGIAPSDTVRTIRELKEHYSDLINRAIEDGISEREAEQRASLALGDEQTLVAEFLNKPELRSFSSRHPKVSYLLGPTTTALASIGVFALLLYFLASSRTWLSSMSAGVEIAWWEKVLLEGLLIFNCYLLVPLLAIATVVFAKQRITKPLWPALGILVLVILGSGWAYTLSWPTDALRGSLSINWGYSFLPRAIRGDHDLQNYIQIILALALASIAWRFYDPLKTLASDT